MRVSERVSMTNSSPKVRPPFAFCRYYGRSLEWNNKTLYMTTRISRSLLTAIKKMFLTPVKV